MSSEFKVALCMSGQLRQWDLAKDNLKWFFSDNKMYEFDYFIHTWNHSSDRSAISKPHEERIVPQEEFDEIVEWYDPKKSMFDMKYKFFYGDDWWSSLFYSFAQSVMLKRQYEIENNFEYDIVVKIRPDVVFNPNMGFNTEYLEDNMLYTTHGGNMIHEFNMFNINDCVFYSNSYTMDILSNVYFYRQKVINVKSGYDKLNFHPLGPGVLLAEYCREYGIVFQSLKGTRGRFQETLLKLGCPVNIDLLNPKEFHKMEKYFRRWYIK